MAQPLNGMMLGLILLAWRMGVKPDNFGDSVELFELA